MKRIYLDNAATTYPKPEEVYERMDSYLRNECVNAGRGSYKSSQKASNLIDETKTMLLQLINSQEGKVIFSSSATLAVNQILRGIDYSDIKNVYISPFEHNAIMRTLHYLQKEFDFNIFIIPFDEITFELKKDELKVMFAENPPDLTVLSHVSNVTGFILPIEECQEMAALYNSLNIADCSQSFGLVNIDVKKEFKNCDFIVFAGHKTLYGPFGIAGFIQLNPNIRLKPLITGGTGSDSTNLEMPEDKLYEPGSANTYAVAGLNSAIKWINRVKRENIYKHEKELLDYALNELKEIDDIEIYSAENLENQISMAAFNIGDYEPHEVGTILSSEFGIEVRTGHHCAPLIGKFLKGRAERGTVRASFSYFTKKEEIDELIEALKSL